MLRIFPVQIRSMARMDSVKSAWRDQAENPESYAGSLLFRGAQESIFAAPDCKMLRFVKNLRRRCVFDNSHGIHRQDTTARIDPMPRSSCVRRKRPMHEWARAGISSVDILPPGFGDANVPTEHKQSNRRD